MKVLDLFSGIGGFSLGLERAGMETIAMCEKDEFCRQILAKHWPDVTIHQDIRSLDGTQYKGTVDIVCGGFPCQPYSVCGKHLGDKDDRHLWPEMLRVIKESNPTWVIGENVSGFVNMALDDVCTDLENESFKVESFIIPACAVDAPHKRDRCWIVAYSNSNDRRNKSGSFSSERETRMEHWGCGDRQSFGRPNSFLDSLDVKLSSDRWEAEPRIYRISNGVPNRMDRIKSLGNSVVPQIVERIGFCIAKLN